MKNVMQLFTLNYIQVLSYYPKLNPKFLILSTRWSSDASFLECPFKKEYKS